MPMRSVSSVLLCSVGTLFLAAAMPPAAALPDQVDMSYEFKQNAITLHEPVILHFKVHNGLAQLIALDLGINWVEGFEFVLIPPQGKRIQGRRQRSEGLSTQPGKLVIGPGEDHQQTLLLNQWFDFDLPGEYVLTATLGKPIEVGETNAVAPQRQRLTLEIKPRDVDRLRDVCAELAHQVSISNGGEAEQEATLKLSYVADPIAVPYLSEVLSGHRATSDLAISGLERIGDDAAVEALLTALNDKFGDIPQLARQSLTRMQDRISNPALKASVTQALTQKPPL